MKSIHEALKNSLQDKIAMGLVRNGYTLYGGYVYKKIVNNDDTNDIDVIHDEGVQKFLQDTYSCVKIESSRFRYPYSCVKIESTRFRCPSASVFNKDVYVDITKHDENSNSSNSSNSNNKSKIFKLHYKLINGIPTVVNSDGNTVECENTINELKNRRYYSWDNMREKDVEYFYKFKDINVFNKLRMLKRFYIPG